MKLIIKKEQLLENLINTSKAISSKNLIPILVGIKFDLREEGLYLSASDTDLSIQTFIHKENIESLEETGSIVINGKYIVEIIRKLPNGPITIEVNDGYKMIIKNENSEFNLNGIDPEEFPNLYLEEKKEPIILNNLIVKNIINQTFFATSTNEARPLLTGINFKINENQLEVIATDSYRLAKKTIHIDNSVDNEINIVIPARNLMELSKILLDDKENVEMHIFTNKILFKYKNILFQSRLLNGTYPATSNIIPTEFKIACDIDLNNLYSMIDRASLLTSDRDKNIVKLSIHNKMLMISSNSPEIGKVEEKVSIDCDADIAISFSSKYMLEALKSFSTKTITLNMNNDSSPIIIDAKEDNSLIQLILPIKTY